MRKRYFLFSVLQLVVNANVVPISQILFIPMIEEVFSSETSVLTRATQRYIPENGILQSHLHENLKSYIALFGSVL
jgi:hypothetical protein